ncbi:unnamed protein product [Closterium sp. Yama58-4]|nr:unnamed protein product [Closterium sp. Yama58-4]
MAHGFKRWFRSSQRPLRAFDNGVLITFLTTASAAAYAAPSLPTPAAPSFPASLLSSSFPESFSISSLAASDESFLPGGLPVASSTQSATAPKGKVFMRYACKLSPPRSNGNIVGDLAATGKYSLKGVESSPSECYVVEKYSDILMKNRLYLVVSHPKNNHALCGRIRKGRYASSDGLRAL